MAISTYAELQAAIAGWLDRDDLATRIPDFISLAEAQMNRLLRARGATGRSTAVIATEFAALPSDFAQAISVRVQTADAWATLSPADPEALSRPPAEVGIPRIYGVVGGELRFRPAPDAGQVVEMTYFAKVPPLGAGAPSNWVLASHPDAYLYGALVHSAPLLRDTEILSTWTALSQAALEQIVAERHQPGGRLRTEITGVRPFDILSGS